MSKHLSAASAHRAIAGVYGIIFAVTGIIAFAYAGSDAWPFVSVGAVVLSFFIGLHLFIAKGAENCRPWARAFSLAVGALLLFGFPVGTILGVWLLMCSINEWVPTTRTSGSLADGWPQPQRESA